MDADFTLPEHKERRKAFRVAIADYVILIHAKEKKYPFHGRDISATGVSFKGRSKAFKPGVGLVLDIVKDGRTLIANLGAKIVWAQNDLVGCAFVNISCNQEDGLCAITLAEQKRLAASRKAEKPQPSACSEAKPTEASPKAKTSALDIDFADPWSSKHKK